MRVAAGMVVVVMRILEHLQSVVSNQKETLREVRELLHLLNEHWDSNHASWFQWLTDWWFDQCFHRGK